MKTGPMSRKRFIIENAVTCHLQETFPSWKSTQVPSSLEPKGLFPCSNFSGVLFTCGVLFFLDRPAEPDAATPLLLGVLCGVMLRARRLYREINETSWLWAAWKRENINLFTKEELTTKIVAHTAKNTRFQVHMSDWQLIVKSMEEKVWTAVVNFLF